MDHVLKTKFTKAPLTWTILIRYIGYIWDNVKVQVM